LFGAVGRAYCTTKLFCAKAYEFQRFKYSHPLTWKLVFD